VLCKRVRRVRTGEPIIEEAFEFFEARDFPVRAEAFTVWMQFRDGNGRTAMALVIEYVPPGDLDAEEIMVARFTLEFENPNTVLEHEATIHAGLPLEREGRYCLRVTADGTTIMQRYFGAFRSAK